MVGCGASLHDTENKNIFFFQNFNAQLQTTLYHPTAKLELKLHAIVIVSLLGATGEKSQLKRVGKEKSQQKSPVVIQQY